MIPISEIFKTVQGEGPLIGRPTIFVRSGGCDYSCSWCDTRYAVDAIHRNTWEKMDADVIWDIVTTLSPTPITITLSGGNPALHDFGPFLQLANLNRYPVVIETQGSIYKPWMNRLSKVILSPKPPSSGYNTPIERVTEIERALFPRTAYKVVVFDDADFEYAVEVYKNRVYEYSDFYMQVGNLMYDDQISYEALMHKQRWLTKRVLDAGLNDVAVLPQMHVWLYGNQRGV